MDAFIFYLENMMYMISNGEKVSKCISIVDRYEIYAYSHLDAILKFYSGPVEINTTIFIDRSFWKLTHDILSGDRNVAIMNIKHENELMRKLCELRISHGDATGEPLKGGFVFGFEFKVYLLEKVDELFEWIVSKKAKWFETD